MFQPESKIWPALFILILLLALAVRLYDPILDPPIAIGGVSQALATDPAHITSFAANKARFGSWELYDIPYWQVFKVSLSSLAAYIAFAIGRPNTAWTNLSGVAASFGGLFFFLLALYNQTKNKDSRYAVCAAIFLSGNFVFIIYNRFPLLESGLLFYSGVIFFLYQHFGHRLWNLAILAIIIALSCLTGKIFGLAAGIAVVSTVLIGDSEKRPAKLIVFIGSLLLSGIALLVILYGDRTGAYYSYLFEHTKLGEDRLFILRGMKEFYVVLFSYGTNSKLYRHSPFLFIAAYSILVMVILVAREAFARVRQNRLLLFSLLWMLAIAAMIAPFNYRPLRYSILLYLPFCSVIALYPAIISKNAAAAKSGKWQRMIWFIILLVLNHYFLIHFSIDLFWYDAYPAKALPVYYAAIAAALLLTAMLNLRIVYSFLIRNAHRALYLIAVFVIASFCFNGYQYYQWVRHQNHSFVLNSTDFSALLGDGALVTGPYAPRLCRETDYKSLVYYFGLEKKDLDIFGEFPVTHVALDKSNRSEAFRDFDQLQNAVFLTDYMIRGKNVSVFYMLDNNPDYIPTDFEQAAIFFQKNRADSALYYNDRFLEQHPGNMAAHKQKVLIYFIANDYNAMLPVLDQIAAAYPDNVDAQGFCAIYYKFLSRRLEQPDLLDRAYKALNRAIFYYYDLNDFLQKSFELN